MRIATIGTGEIVHNILEAVSKTEGISCEAVYSRSFNKGKVLGDVYGIGKVYTSLSDLMKDDRVNFIYIASPNSLHYEQALMALKHGKHVICEKPFSTTLEQTRNLIEIAKEKRLFLFDAVPPSFLPNFYVIREKLQEIGRIKLVMSNYSQYSGRYDQLLKGEVTNVFSKEYAGGCLQDIGFYNLYFNVAMFGKPKEAMYFPNMYPNQVDTSGVLVLQYSDFVSSNVGAKDTWGVNFVQIEGEQGYIYIKNGSNALSEIKVVTRQGEEVINQQEDISRWLYEIREIVKIVKSRDYEECYKRLEVTKNVIEVLEHARKHAGIYFKDEETL